MARDHGLLLDEPERVLDHCLHMMSIELSDESRGIYLREARRALAALRETLRTSGIRGNGRPAR